MRHKRFEIMNSLKLRLFRVLLLCAGTGLLVAGCSNDDDSPRELSSKTTLTLSKYYNDKGATTLPTWGRNDKAGLFAADQSVPEAVYAAPIQPGSQKSLFLFTLSAPQHAASTVVAFWPSDADLRCENGTLKTVVPTAQTGAVAPLLAGKATARLNAYEGCSMELTNLFCTMYVSVKKGNYSVSEAVVKANGGEGIAGDLTVGIDDWSASASAQTITVTLPAPLDCSKETQLIPVMVAPVTLSQGYTVTLTATNGQTFKVEKTESVTLEAGGKHETDDARSNFVTELIFCGDNMIGSKPTERKINKLHKRMNNKYSLPKDGGLISESAPRDIIHRYEKIHTKVYENEYEGVQYVADNIVKAIRMYNEIHCSNEVYEESQPFVLGLTTGRTPLGLYRELVKRHHEGQISFRNVAVYSLDEFYPIRSTEQQSRNYRIHEEFLNHIDILPENVHIPDVQFHQTREH